ncbi:MAG TPA: sugar nucleotide-binding protein, partial [Bradyrhizobium sp.]|nr:sugar nucleotide-binding protein [Bradyrhizobium sp.]
MARGLVETAGAGVQVVAVGRPELDLAEEKSVAAAVARERPDIVVNAAAYTAVDKAESDEAAAYAVNATAVGLLAEGAKQIGARLAHVSTDFVFDGLAGIP